MRIDSIEVKNFRGIRDVSLKDLKSTVIIAGANGSGKSCIFDAIRLLKSAYGGYQQNEWHHWMSEFQINFANNNNAFKSFFQDQSKELSIKIFFRIHPEERKYLEDHGRDLVRASVWRLIAPEMHGWSSHQAAPIAAQYRDREKEVSSQTEDQFLAMKKELSQDLVMGHLWGNAGGDIHFAPSKALEIIFSSFRPGELGVIDYHGPLRMYQREQVSNVNLDLNAREEQGKQHALYNYNNKYSGVKSEMASSYIKELLSKEAGVPISEQNTLGSTLKELFSTFFPDKEFLGLKPTPDGGVEFPVKTSSGAIHDLNELSAGEKEILYGYLRMRNSAPSYSIILIDEPELHLNPRLIQGLPEFYHNHLGIALDNQIWLVTHSDALLREAVGRPEYSIFHMIGAGHDQSSPQITTITMGEAAERAIISLVGDIAAYRPGKKVVIFEGGGDTDFDSNFTTRLFPELLLHANVISGGNKLRVRELHDVLDAASQKDTIPFKTFSITDHDGDEISNSSPSRYRWDVYHIENYLLEVNFIKRALSEAGEMAGNLDDNAIYDKLRESAKRSLQSLVRHEITEKTNKAFKSSINFGFDPKCMTASQGISEAISRSISKLQFLSENSLTLEKLSETQKDLELKYEEDIATDNWRKTFRGRDILKDFSRENCKISYETLRNIIISRMSEAGYKPAGMRSVIDSIIVS